MPRATIVYDDGFMNLVTSRKGKGPYPSAWKKVEQSRLRILEEAHTEKQGWLLLPFDQELVKTVEHMVSETKSFDTLLVLGIGGSDLGTRAMLQAVPHAKRVVFAGSSTDPDELALVLVDVNWSKTLVNVISKSGETLETMSTFLVVRDLMKKVIGDGWASQVVATTDAERGTLHDLAMSEGYRLLPVPNNIGGRFSVFTAVGLFPMSWAGIDVKEVLEGAAEASRELDKGDEECVSMKIATWHAVAYEEKKTEWVLMPYAAHLYYFAQWYRQLFAESLGKKKGKVTVGPTPIVSMGPTDQHSQLQSYIEGPANKVITFLEVAKFHMDLQVPSVPAAAEALRPLLKKKLHQLIHAERLATAESLAQSKRPSGTLFLSQMNERVLGRLMQTYMIAVALIGHAWGINPYNQPAVEDGKRRVQEWLKAKKPLLRSPGVLS